MGYNIDDYEVVEVRLEKFWKENPDGKIKTKLVESSENGQMVSVKQKSMSIKMILNQSQQV